MSVNRVLHGNQKDGKSSFRPLSKDEVKALVASGLQNRVLALGLDRVADEMGCTTKTVRSALSHESLLEADKLGNLMARDPSVFHEWFRNLGLRVSYYSSEMSPDMHTVSAMASAVASFVEALEDGRRDHQETLNLARMLRPLIPRLSAIVHEADELSRPREVRA